MKLDIGRMLNYKYILYNNENKALLFFIVTNYFKLNILDLETLCVLANYSSIMFNRIYNYNYAVDIYNEVNNFINCINPRLFLINENLIDSFKYKINNLKFIYFSDVTNINSLSDFLEYLFSINRKKYYKLSDFNIYQIIQNQNLNFIHRLISLDINLSSNMRIIKNIITSKKIKKYKNLLLN